MGPVAARGRHLSNHRGPSSSATAAAPSQDTRSWSATASTEPTAPGRRRSCSQPPGRPTSSPTISPRSWRSRPTRSASCGATRTTLRCTSSPTTATGLDGVACRRQQRPVHQAERHATDRNRGIRLERDDVLPLAQRRAHPLTSQDSGRTLAPGASPRLILVGTGPAARHTWEAVLPTDPTVSVFQTPAWLDAICAATSYEDATCEYRTEDGRSVVLPIVRRGCPAGSRSRAPCPLAAVRADSYRATA